MDDELEKGELIRISEGQPGTERPSRLDLTDLLVHGEDPVNGWMLSEAHPKSELAAQLRRIEEKLDRLLEWANG